MKYGVKKLLSGVLLGIFAFAGVAFAEADYTYINHQTTTFLKEGKPVYDDAMFQYINFYVEYTLPSAVADESAVGAFTIKNGTYAYWDENDQRQNVAGEDKTFDLRYQGGDATYAEFSPRFANGINVLFRRAADGGLQGKAYNWTLNGDSSSGTMPNFRTTKEQLDAYVPYVELGSSAVSWKMVLPKTGGAVVVPFQSRYRIGLWAKDGTRLARSDWQPFEANATPSGEFPIPADVDKQAINRVRMEVQDVQANPALPYRYRWEFFVAAHKEEDVSGLAPLKLQPGKEEIVKLTLQPGVRLDRNTLYPFSIGDRSVLEDTDWTTEIETNVVTLTLTGLKEGTTDLAVVYRDAAGDFCYTAPVQVVVADSSKPEPDTDPDPSNGGGGCNAGYGFMGLLLTGFALRKYLTL
ncbi:MAG: hypothetical protein LBT65_11015 [Synergistaceae bacterium]|jgi:hypothetical protein|nr:hypothetical protein [Synergistaceae bacterium]